jgi:chromosome segregation ATPase
MIKDEPLSNGDLLQIGGFLFEVQLPEEAGERPLVDPEEERHLRRSRRRLARRALTLRSRLREQQDRAEEFERRTEEVNQLADELRTRLRSCDQQTARLQQTERDLAQDRERLEQERAALQARIAQLEQEKERGGQEAAAPPWQAATGEDSHRLDIRQQELDRYAQHLRATREGLEVKRARVEQAWASLRRVCEEVGSALAGGEPVP